MRLLLLVLLLVTPPASAQVTSDIRLNQIGFYPDAPKVAMVVGAEEGLFYVVNTSTSDTVFTGTLDQARTWAPSGEAVRKADFSALTTPGTYALAVPGRGVSYPFEIAGRVHEEVLRASLKGYYYQRTALFLHPKYAGAWARAAGHPDTDVLVHASAATASRPAGTRISAPRGWYDAGDFNKYIVNSGISVYTLLAAYEHFPAVFDALDTNIPESGNALPDLLDELLWNLRWMMKMQDEDGGVYHKLTHANFHGTVMPAQATAPRYVVQKSTAATLNFAAVAAQGVRVFADALPGLADSLLTAALAAWDWADAHPNVIYNQSQLNQQFDPDITTGEYGGSNLTDEWRWAAAELYVTTGDDRFFLLADAAQPNVPSWGDVEALGLYSLLHYRKHLGPLADTTAYRQRLLSRANTLLNGYTSSAYGVVMGQSAGDFVWGSNSVAANQAMLLVQAYRLTGDRRYAEAALSNLDYLLGRNGTGYSFLTGYGDKTPMRPHHRQSEADGVHAPVPGLLAGGPNPGQQDGCTYPSSLPAKSYVDSYCSYASNEITINWNAPMVYLAAAMEALFGQDTGTVNESEDRAEYRPGLRVSPAFPNPLHTATRIRYELAEDSVVSITLHDVMGREVQPVMHAQPRRAGVHEVVVEAAALPSGTYFFRIHTPSTVATRPFTVVR